MISAKSKPPPRRSRSRARATPKRWRNGRVSEMRVGILGSGLMGGTLGTLFARAGHEVVFSYSRSERRLKRLAREAQGKARAGTPADAAREADALLRAVHHGAIFAAYRTTRVRDRARPRSRISFRAIRKVR